MDEVALNIDDIAPLIGNLHLTNLTQGKLIRALQERVAELEKQAAQVNGRKEDHVLTDLRAEVG